MHQVPYDNLSDALGAGRNGEVWGVIHFGENFTQEFELREETISKENIIGRQINITLDSSSEQKNIQNVKLSYSTQICLFLTKINRLMCLLKNGLGKLTEISSKNLWACADTIQKPVRCLLR